MSDPKAIPDATAIEKAASLEIFDVKGAKIKFGSLFETQKTIVVFIRHFFCGSCQQYVSMLANIPQEAFTAAGTKVVVVGCGEWNPIEGYHETTGFKGEIYADPTRELYRTLGMNIESLKGTPAGETRKSYLTISSFKNAILSTLGGLRHPSLIGKQGNVSQLGGEFVLGPGVQCSFAYRMQHTEDHVEIADLMKAAGVDVPA